MKILLSKQAAKTIEGMDSKRQRQIIDAINMLDEVPEVELPLILRVIQGLAIMKTLDESEDDTVLTAADMAAIAETKREDAVGELIDLNNLIVKSP